MSDQEIARRLNRTVKSVRSKARKLQLLKSSEHKSKMGNVGTLNLRIGSQKVKRWTKEEIETLWELYPIRRNSDIAGILDRTVSALTKKAYKLGLRKES